MVDDDQEISSFDHAIAQQALRYSGAIGVGDAADAVEIEREHTVCIAYCLAPGGRRKGIRCPACYGRIAIRDIYSNEIEPGGTRFMWLVGAFLGGWAAAWRDATAGMVRR